MMNESNRNKLKYVLITPARNEEEFIRYTIESVIHQTIQPLKWIIVSDGSTDKTDEIVNEYEKVYDFITLLKRKKSFERNFASKVNSIQVAFQSIEPLNFDFIGFSDGDMSCEEDFYESVIAKMNANPKQGIGGGIVYEMHNKKWLPVKASYDWTVSGAMQMFRRKCYEDIGGYQPLAKGGIDTIAEVMARMKGWEVKTFEDIKLFHHRIMGSKKGNVIKSNFRRGILEYSIGYHSLIQFLRFFLRITSKPFFISSLFRTLGYYYALFMRHSFAVSNDIIKFYKKEQLNRLFRIISK